MRRFAMMLAFLGVGLGLGLGLAGCGTSSKHVTMPKVTGKRLDVAKQAIKDAGFSDDPKVIGGGVFGVVVDANWTVCGQSPATGATVTNKPELTVDRSCDSSTSPSTIPSSSPTDEASPNQPTPTTPAATILTVQNSKDLKILLTRDYCDPRIGTFIHQHAAQRIAFDGSVMAKGAGNYSVAPGDKGVNSVIGPVFQFRQVPGLSLHMNDKIRITAQVLSGFNENQCLVHLTAVSTKPR
jgi:hypothetical protein